MYKIGGNVLEETSCRDQAKLEIIVKRRTAERGERVVK